MPGFGRFLNADGILNKNVYRYGSNNAISRIDSEGHEDVGIQELLNAKYVVFLKEETPLYIGSQISENYHIVQVPQGSFVGLPAYVYKETDDMYYVALPFYDEGEALSTQKGWIQKESASKTLWDILFGENQVFESVDVEYAGVSQLREFLKDLGYNVESGKTYNSNTIDAVKDIQKRYNIGVDGKAGKKTFICVTWEWLLYGNDYTILPRQIDKMNNPQYAIK